MPVPKPKTSEIVDLNKHRKQKGQGKMKPSPPARPELKDLPAVVVRTRGGKIAELINLPMRDIGADMVLILIERHPEASLKTSDGAYLRLREIAMVVDPERGEIEVEAARQAADDAPAPFRPIQVRLNMRREETVGLVNIPDSQEGATLLRYILEEFRRDRTGAPSGYTLFTTDYGYIPVHELAEANLPRPRQTE